MLAVEFPCLGGEELLDEKLKVQLTCSWENLCPEVVAACLSQELYGIQPNVEMLEFWSVGFANLW